MAPHIVDGPTSSLSSDGLEDWTFSSGVRARPFCQMGSNHPVFVTSSPCQLGHYPENLPLHWTWVSQDLTAKKTFLKYPKLKIFHTMSFFSITCLSGWYLVGGEQTSKMGSTPSGWVPTGEEKGELLLLTSLKMGQPPSSWASTALEKSPEMRMRSLKKSCMSRSALYSRMNLTLRQNLLFQSKLLPAPVWALSLQDHQGSLREMSNISAFLYSAYNPTGALERTQESLIIFI